MKLSIITINYNNAAGLDKTIRSVLSQSWKNFEYIVIDGGSTDGSTQVIDKLKDQLTYSISEKDKGIYDAMNKGLQQASGEYVIFLNSGDYLYTQDVFEKVSRHFGEADILYGNLKIDDNGELSDGYMPRELTVTHMLNDTLWHPVSFIRLSLFKKYGLYNLDYKICGDYDFFFNVVVDKRVTTKYLNQFISVFGLNGLSSDPANVDLIKKEKRQIQRKYLSEVQIQAALKPKGRFSFLKWFR